MSGRLTFRCVTGGGNPLVRTVCAGVKGQRVNLGSVWLGGGQLLLSHCWMKRESETGGVPGEHGHRLPAVCFLTHCSGLIGSRCCCLLLNFSMKYRAEWHWYYSYAAKLCARLDVVTEETLVNKWQPGKTFYIHFPIYHSTTFLISFFACMSIRSSSILQ